MDDTIEAVVSMYRTALKGCSTREACMKLSAEICETINRLLWIAEEDCYDRAMECDREA